MTCKTRCCPKFLGRYRATTTINENTLVIELCNVGIDEVIQGDKISFFIPHCINYPTSNIANVEVKIEGITFIATKFGNVKWDQIKPRTCYTGIIGTENPTITILNDLCHSKFDYPTYKQTATSLEKASNVE